MLICNSWVQIMRRTLLQTGHLPNWCEYSTPYAPVPLHLTLLILGFWGEHCLLDSLWRLSGPKYLRIASVNQYPSHALLQLINRDKDAMRWKQDVLFNQVLGLFYWPQHLGGIYQTSLLFWSSFIPASKNCWHKNTCTGLTSELQAGPPSMTRSGSSAHLCLCLCDLG